MNDNIGKYTTKRSKMPLKVTFLSIYRQVSTHIVAFFSGRW